MEGGRGWWRGAARVLEIRISQIRGWLGTGVYRELGAHEIRLKFAQTHAVSNVSSYKDSTTSST